jgi:uncharacterized HAD superfamily protein
MHYSHLPSLGIDLDGVVIDHKANFLEVSQKRGYQLAPWQTNSNLFTDFVADPDCTAIKQHIYEKVRHKAEIYPNVLAFFKKFKENITIVSVQQKPDAEKKTRAWLKREGISALIPATRIILVRSKEMKLQRIMALRPDVFIDDDLSILGGLPKNTLPVMFDPVGAHRHMEIPGHVRLAHSWRQMPRIIEAISDNA